MSKKKRGSSLITVVVIFSILITFGTAALSLTATDYQSRIAEGNRIKNLYYSESGLDITYGVIEKMIETSITKSNNSVDDFMQNLNSQIQKEINMIKNGKNDDLKYVNLDGSLNEENINKEKNIIFKDMFKKWLTEASLYTNNTSKIIYAIENSIYYDNSGNIINFYNSQKPAISVINIAKNESNGKIVAFNGDNLELEVQSKFSTLKDIFGSLTQKPFERIVSAKFIIHVPDYKDNYYVETNMLDIKVNPVWKKAISIDGNLILNGNTEITGDIFAKGKNDDNIIDKVYDKYKGGIIIQGNNEGKGDTILTGDIVTSKSFHVKDTNNVKIQDPNDINKKFNLYAKNVYVGKSSSSERDTINSSLMVKGSVYTDNDLALNAKNSKIEIDNYYGIGDLTKPSNTSGSRSLYDREMISSSILVNTDDIGKGSSITINDEAYIMGTAYIKTQPDTYQTGESVAVKGNYIAYASQLMGNSALYESDGINSYNELYGKTAKDFNLDSSKVYFKYYNPLQLVDSFNDSKDLGKENIKLMTVEEKSKYFKYYSKENNNLNLKGKGIKLPDNTVSIGAFITEKGDSFIVKSPSYTPEKEEEVRKFRKNYASQVFEMGNPSNINEDELLDEYLEGDVKKTVTNQVNFSLINENIPLENDEDKIILSKNKNVVIVGKNSPDYVGSSDEIIINIPSGIANGIIITGGNVTIKGELNFTGTIIAAGDLTLYGDGYKKRIIYNSNYVDKLIAYNHDKYFNKIFNTNDYIYSQKIEVFSQTDTAKNLGSNSIITDKLITKKSWKLIK